MRLPTKLAHHVARNALDQPAQGDHVGFRPSGLTGPLTLCQWLVEVCTSLSRLLARSGKQRVLVVTSALLLTGVGALGADKVVFGPRTYTRGFGTPVAVKETFRVQQASGEYTLRVVNHGVTSAVIQLNGVVVLDPDEFTIGEGGAPVPFFTRPVELLRGWNEIIVELRSQPGTSLTVEILSGGPTDTTPPTITASAAPSATANGWNNTTVIVTFSCADSGSGIFSCPGSAVVNAEGANQVVSGTATDNSGYSSTASVTLNIDKTVPSVAVTLSPPPGVNGWNNSAVTAHFECSDVLSGVATCPADEVVATQGANLTVTGTAIDRAGNTAQVVSVPFSIDSLPPTVVVSLAPPPNGNGWNNTPVLAHFTCADSGSGAASCPADQTLSADGANQAISGLASDLAGNAATAATTVSIDQTPPLLFLNPPRSDTVLTPGLAISGTVSDTTSGLASVTCNGATVTVIGSEFQCEVTLTPGMNSIGATATDAAGNTTTSSFLLTYLRAPIVTITSPPHLSYFNISPTTVTGTVDDPTATVTVNSIAATVADGFFTIPLPLAEGPNIITATATAASGTVGTASVEVTLDTTPPRVTITSPPDGFTTAEASISVAGNVNDIVVGTVNDEQAQVSVNGTGAQVANRTFLALAVPLASGVNTIQAVARDRVGNAATTEILVTRQAPTQPHIRPVSGNGQTGVIGSRLSAPLVIELVDGLANPVPSKTVIFKVIQNDGTLTASGEPAATVLATTDAQGRAQASWTLGNRAGAGGNVVDAYSVGFEGTAIFAASGTQGPAANIVVDTGDDQIGAIGQPLPKPFIAVVVDGGNNRLAGVPVTFSVQQGGGSFDGQPTFTTTSDSDGRVAATLTLGLEEGNANNLVEVNFPQNPSPGAAFTASGRAPGPPAATTVSGVVLDNSNLAIPGVTVRAVLTSALRSSLTAMQAAPAVQTDAHGQFTVPAAPVGLIKLMIDGTTAEPQGTYPSLEYDLVTVSGHKNDVGQPIYLLPLSTVNELCVTATTGGGTLTIPEAPGFSLSFGPGQVTFPGGSKSGCIGVTAVNGDKVPMVPGFGQQPRFIVTIQPAGAVFNPPAPISLPNVDGLAPRAITEMYSYDHDISAFVAIGTGVVSDDGALIESAPGVGVLKAGWHCGGNSAPSGTAAQCGPCRRCTGGVCMQVDTVTPPQAAPNDCRREVCHQGRVVSVNDDGDRPPQHCASCNNGTPVPPQTDQQCCATVTFAGGFVVCCNGSQLACVGSSFTSNTPGDTILTKCAQAHEKEHFGHVDCPTGSAECTTTRPGWRPGQDSGQGECQAYSVEIVCLQGANCGGDVACQARVDGRIAQIRGLTPAESGMTPGCSLP